MIVASGTLRRCTIRFQGLRTDRKASGRRRKLASRQAPERAERLWFGSTGSEPSADPNALRHETQIVKNG